MFSNCSNSISNKSCSSQPSNSNKILWRKSLMFSNGVANTQDFTWPHKKKKLYRVRFGDSGGHPISRCNATTWLPTTSANISVTARSYEPKLHPAHIETCHFQTHSFSIFATVEKRNYFEYQDNYFRLHFYQNNMVPAEYQCHTSHPK